MVSQASVESGGEALRWRSNSSSVTAAICDAIELSVAKVMINDGYTL
jgi:hypothetical protein